MKTSNWKEKYDAIQFDMDEFIGGVPWCKPFYNILFMYRCNGISFTLCTRMKTEAKIEKKKNGLCIVLGTRLVAEKKIKFEVRNHSKVNKSKGFSLVLRKNI